MNNKTPASVSTLFVENHMVMVIFFNQTRISYPILWILNIQNEAYQGDRTFSSVQWNYRLGSQSNSGKQTNLVLLSLGQISKPSKKPQLLFSLIDSRGLFSNCHIIAVDLRSWGMCPVSWGKYQGLMVRNREKKSLSSLKRIKTLSRIGFGKR